LKEEPVTRTGGTNWEPNLQNFVMVPVESVKPGDVVAPAKTPVRHAQPVAEVNWTDGGIELVFIDKSLYSEAGIRTSRVFPLQYPVALIGGVEDNIADVVEKWLAEAGDAAS